MVNVPEPNDSPRGRTVHVAICVDPEVFDRFGRVLRHLLVGLVDQAVQIRLASSDPRIEALTLGPIQTLLHEPLTWPMASRRIDHLLEALSHPAPTIIHALSHHSYRVASKAAASFDAELVLQVTGLADCDALSNVMDDRVVRYVAFADALAAVLSEQLNIARDRIELIPPGMLTSRRLACFAAPDRIPTLLCMAPLEPDTGMERLIEACHLLRRRDRQFMLFLLGEGRQESALRRLIRERDLADCITLAHPGGNIAQALQGADIYVRPGDDVAFTDDGLQAMGAGLAVVTRPSPVCDCFIHEQTAVVCEKPTPAALADAVERLLTDREGARTLAQQAVDYVRNQHAISRMAEQTGELYRQLALKRATFPIKE